MEIAVWWGVENCCKRQNKICVTTEFQRKATREDVTFKYVMYSNKNNNQRGRTRTFKKDYRNEIKQKSTGNGIKE